MRGTRGFIKFVATVCRCDMAADIKLRREREEALTRNVHAKVLAKMARAQQSEYRREVVERHLPYCLQRAVISAKHPCSPWWKEYLLCVVRSRSHIFIYSYIHIFIFIFV